MAGRYGVLPRALWGDQSPSALQDLGDVNEADALSWVGPRLGVSLIGLMLLVAGSVLAGVMETAPLKIPGQVVALSGAVLFSIVGGMTGGEFCLSMDGATSFSVALVFTSLWSAIVGGVMAGSEHPATRVLGLLVALVSVLSFRLVVWQNLLWLFSNDTTVLGADRPPGVRDDPSDIGNVFAAAAAGAGGAPSTLWQQLMTREFGEWWAPLGHAFVGSVLVILLGGTALALAVEDTEPGSMSLDARLVVILRFSGELVTCAGAAGVLHSMFAVLAEVFPPFDSAEWNRSSYRALCAALALALNAAWMVPHGTRLIGEGALHVRLAGLLLLISGGVFGLIAGLFAALLIFARSAWELKHPREGDEPDMDAATLAVPDSELMPYPRTALLKYPQPDGIGGVRAAWQALRGLDQQWCMRRLFLPPLLFVFIAPVAGAHMVLGDALAYPGFLRLKLLAAVGEAAGAAAALSFFHGLFCGIHFTGLVVASAERPALEAALHFFNSLWLVCRGASDLNSGLEAAEQRLAGAVLMLLALSELHDLSMAVLALMAHAAHGEQEQGRLEAYARGPIMRLAELLARGGRWNAGEAHREFRRDASLQQWYNSLMLACGLGTSLVLAGALLKNGLPVLDAIGGGSELLGADSDSGEHIQAVQQELLQSVGNGLGILGALLLLQWTLASHLDAVLQVLTEEVVDHKRSAAMIVACFNALWLLPFSISAMGSDSRGDRVVGVAALLLGLLCSGLGLTGSLRMFALRTFYPDAGAGGAGEADPPELARIGLVDPKAWAQPTGLGKLWLGLSLLMSGYFFILGAILQIYWGDPDERIVAAAAGVVLLLLALGNGIVSATMFFSD